MEKANGRGRHTASGLGGNNLLVVCNSFSQSHMLPGEIQNPLLQFHCGFLVCVLYDSDLPAAIYHGIVQPSELPMSSFPVSLL